MYVTVPDDILSEASCIPCPRTLTKRRPSSKDRAPLNIKAVSSPTENPAVAIQFFTESSSYSQSASTAAREETNMAA